MAMDAAMIERLIKDEPARRAGHDRGSARRRRPLRRACRLRRLHAARRRVQQHQMVYQALRGRMGNELHALALQTSAPED